MNRIGVVLTLSALVFHSTAFVGCAALRYPEPETAAQGASPQPTGQASLPAHAGSGDDTAAEHETALSWSDLTRRAREHRQQGELEEAAQCLEQAAILVANLPPGHVRRRTVFGLRARLAETLARNGEIARADRLADQLITEAEAHPELGDAALVSLALSQAARREAAAQEREAGLVGEGDDPLAAPVGSDARSPLELRRIALEVSQAGSLERDRLRLATRVADDAHRAGELPLARNAVEQALADAPRLAPSNLEQMAWLLILRSRIASDQGDLGLAITDATRAREILEEASSPESSLAVAEATLAEALARSGEGDRALDIARDATRRLEEGEATFHDHARRLILGALARVERSRGEADRARAHYLEALEVPGQDSDTDRDLVRRLREELGLLEEGASSASIPSPQ